MGGGKSKCHYHDPTGPLRNEIAALRSQMEATSSESRKALEVREKELAATLAKLEKCNNMVSSLSEKNQGLARSVSELSDALQASEAIVRESRRAHDELMAFLRRTGVCVRKTGKTILISPKGSGKSTLLNLLGFDVEPSSDFADGTTCDVSFPEYGDLVDTVGVDVTYTNMCRLFAIFLRDGFPKSMMVMSMNGRILSILPLLNLFLVSDFYYCPLEAGMLNSLYSGYCKEYDWHGSRAEYYRLMPCDYVKKSLYCHDEATLKGLEGVHLFTHRDRLSPSVSSFDGAMAMLADPTSIPEQSCDATVSDVVKINIYTEYKALLSFEGTLTAFLNRK